MEGRLVVLYYSCKYHMETIEEKKIIGCMEKIRCICYQSAISTAFHWVPKDINSTLKKSTPRICKMNHYAVIQSWLTISVISPYIWSNIN